MNDRLAGDHLYGKWQLTWVSLVMSLVLVCLCCPFSHEMSCLRSGTELSQFLKIFPTYSFIAHKLLLSPSHRSDINMTEIL